MRALPQLAGGLVSAIVVIALIGGSLVLTAGDLNVASLVSIPSPTTSATFRIPSAPTVVWTPNPLGGAQAADTPTFVPTSTCPRPPGWIDHLVTEGEDLSGIAARYGIDPVVLQVNNCLVVAFVTPDMVLFVPAPPTLPPTVMIFPLPTVVVRPTVCGPPLAWTIYRVRPGDTLSSIARATGTTVRALMLANCLPSDKIRVGQILYVPRPPVPIVTIPFRPTGTPTPSSSPTDTPTPVATFVTIEPTTPVIPTFSPPSETPVPVQSPTPEPTVDDPPATETPPPTTEPLPTPVPPTATLIPTVTP